MSETSQTPRVALLVPIHNAAPFIEQTLDSIRDQTYPSWHAVLVDDASSDGSAEIADEYARRYPDRFTFVRLATNVGVVEARNRAAEAAPDGELAVLLDHDDWLREDYLERMLEVYDAEVGKGRRVGIVGCDASLFMDGETSDKTWSDYTGWYEPADLDTLVQRNPVFGRAVFSREAFAAVGGFSSECAGADDWDLWVRIVEAGWEVALTREPLAVYRVHSTAFSQNRVVMSQAQLVVHERMLERGTLSHRQRRLVRRSMRHLRAVLARERFKQAWRGGRRIEAVRHVVAGLPHGIVAIAQDPARWLRRRGPRPLGY